jgi:AcrR family transcriptional regulator
MPRYSVFTMSIDARRRRRPRDRKAQLASVAAELFGARGFHEVGIADIATASGVTGPALYRHFSDNDQVEFLAVSVDEPSIPDERLTATGWLGAALIMAARERSLSGRRMPSLLN